MASNAHLNDHELLLAFIRNEDEAAFATLAARHVDMIFAVSMRRSGNRQLAEEATQNVLIALSRNAKKFSAQDSNITAWLHTSTKFEIAKLQRREERIKKREHAYAHEQMKTTSDEEDETFLRLMPMLDQAIDSLRSHDREVIVRRYLQGQDYRRIGEALGISEDTAQKRTSRAFDALNRFFKRKAGITVSAAALTTGIGQHCADAAPAACLQFTASAATTSFASIISTSTIAAMSITKISAIAAGITVLGGVIAILNSTATNNPETSSSSPAGSTQSSPAPPITSTASNNGNQGGTTSIPESENPYSPNEEIAKLEAMSPHPSPDEMARRLASKHKQLLKDLTADLGLSDSQAASIKSILDTRVKTFRTELDQMADPAAQKETIQKAGSLIRGTGLREEIAAILSETQLTAFDERENKTLQSQIESLAYRELSTLTPTLKLTEEQKDKVFELLQTSSAENLRDSGDTRAFMALMQNKTPTQLDFTTNADADFFQEIMDGPNAPPPDSPEFKKRVTEYVTTQTNKQLELLAPVLDPSQKQRYHDLLISKSMLPMFGIELPSPPTK